jgi:hypothetical protein
MEVMGCVHVHIKGGKITNVFSRLTNLPDDGVVHLVPEVVLSAEEFIQSHPGDKNEVDLEAKRAVFDLRDATV